MAEKDLEDRKGRIFEFDPTTQLPEAGVLVFTGKTKSGKTTAMIDILYHYRERIDMPIAFVGSMETAILLREYMPECQIFTEFREDVLKRTLEKAEEDFETGGKKKQIVVGFFIDDLSYLKSSVFNTEIMRRCASNSRHDRFLFLISTQYCKDIPTFIRDATMRVFICANKNPKQREKIFEAYNSYFYNFHDFDKVMVRLTENHGIMVMDNESSSGYSLEESVFRWRACRNREFKVAPNSPIWDFNRRWLNERYKEMERKTKHRKEEESKKVARLVAEKKKKRALKRIPGDIDIDFKAKRPRTERDTGRFYRIR